METTFLESFDGARLAAHTAGEGPPVVLLHGFLASARTNWFGPGIAGALTAAGRRVIAPDLRGHGGSDAPTEAQAWPADVLASDLLALLDQLDLGEFDLVGYSLGARTAVRAVVRGARPRRLVLGGMGDTGLMQAGARAAMFEDAIRNGERASNAQAGRRVQKMMADAGLKPEAMLGVLAAFQATSEAELRAIDIPTLVVCGEADRDNGSPQALVEILPRAELRLVPGDHLGAVGEPALAQAMVEFLGR